MITWDLLSNKDKEIANMICANGHEMELEEVETIPAHQGFSGDGSGIIDATYDTMWVCTHKDCEEIEIYEKEESDDEPDAWEE
jgi:hypothetical protein